MAILSISTVFGVAVIALPIYCVALAIYRLYFHPLAKFPGPKLAALTHWYEFYFDVVKRGKFMFELQSIHERYGAIIRITPNELHVNDPEFYDELYGTTSRHRNKYGPFYTVAAPQSVFATVDHEHHRLRRGALNPFFSKRAVTQLEPLIQGKVAKLASRFQQALENGEVFRADAAYTALTTDVINRYSFARDDDYLSEHDFKVSFKIALSASFEALPLLRALPWMSPLMNALPPTWAEMMNPQIRELLENNKLAEMRIKPILDQTESAYDIEQASHRSIFHELRDSSLPPHEKTVDRLKDDGQIIVGAGTETTAATLTHLTFHLLSNKKVLEKLRLELRRVLPTPTSIVSWTKLEQLPYLSAVVSEGLRMSIGVSTRLPRVATDEVLTYKDWVIPFGTPVSESSYFILMNPQLFPKPAKFHPERWITNGEYDRNLDKYIVNFGKGSRQCLGMNLAYAELYITVATIFRRFEMELFETTFDDIVMVHDFFVPVPRLDSKGVRIRVMGEVKD